MIQKQISPRLNYHMSVTYRSLLWVRAPSQIRTDDFTLLQSVAFDHSTIGALFIYRYILLFPFSNRSISKYRVVKEQNCLVVPGGIEPPCLDPESSVIADIRKDSQILCKLGVTFSILQIIPLEILSIESKFFSIISFKVFLAKSSALGP